MSNPRSDLGFDFFISPIRISRTSAASPESRVKFRIAAARPSKYAADPTNIEIIFSSGRLANFDDARNAAMRSS
ncbi:hypothetical protein [Adlercreutzia caecimuris]|uniref:Uncharacterized protein n=1 Tax=Adlercreutzia caecimuris TaxID=671266 RepID=A0A4S4G128_9ACTN|nr:hypothetical protein [Adlercreutzia caecimuris]THG36883.1 hypothetical protein E5986_08255 [Adlercreutzia caecimuris]